MVLQLAFHTIILMMIWPIYPSASAQNSTIAKPGCELTCGSVPIPYPFGMNPNCYADRWFEIECRNSTSHQVDQTPYLKSINLEVTSIDQMSSKVEIMNPVFRWNCQGSKDGGQVIDLKRSPFVYSKEDNKLTAIGCNKIAFLHSDGSEVSGCVSVCDEYDNEEVNNNVAFGSDGCLGRFCCETSLPSFLSEYNATLEDVRSRNVSGQCSHVLIGREYWFRINSGAEEEYRSFGDLGNLGYVPAVLEWEIMNSSNMKLPADAN